MLTLVGCTKGGRRCLHAIIFADRGIQRIGGIIITVGAQVATILTARSDRRTLQVGVRVSAMMQSQP